MKHCLDDAIETLMDRTHDLFHPQRREAACNYLCYQREQLNRLHQLTRHGQELSWRVHEFESLLLNRYHNEEAITKKLNEFRLAIREEIQAQQARVKSRQSLSPSLAWQRENLSLKELYEDVTGAVYYSPVDKENADPARIKEKKRRR